jgi:pilus assembly protein CpaF
MTALRDTRAAQDSPPADGGFPDNAAVDPAGASQASTDPTSIPFLAEPLPGPAAPPQPARAAASPWLPPAQRAGASGTNVWSSIGHAMSRDVVHRGPDVDWSLVAQLRALASKQLAERAAAKKSVLTRPEREQLALDIIKDLIDQNRTGRANTDGTTFTATQLDELAQAVFDALYRMGRLQPLLDDDRVENILIYGCDVVWLELSDGSLVRGPDVADSDEQLVDDLQFIASRSEANARSFSEARPRLHLELDDGSRLAAVAWVTKRPQVTIRRHRIIKVTLDDLAKGGLMTPLAAAFLAAAVKDRRSIVVSGSPGAGKTTLARALCSHIHPLEQIASIESERELHLDDQHAFVREWEARPGSGEIGPDGRQAGEYTLSDAVWDSLRFNVQRTVVGEVRGPEMIAMLKAMENGSGTLSTTHARNAAAAIRKLTTCAMEAGPQYTHDMVTMKLAEAVDVIVHIELTLPDDADQVNTETADPPVRRRVTEILAISPGDMPGTFARTRVFITGPDGSLVPDVLPDEYHSLARHGFDLAAYDAAKTVGVG